MPTRREHRGRAGGDRRGDPEQRTVTVDGITVAPGPAGGFLSGDASAGATDWDDWAPQFLDEQRARVSEKHWLDAADSLDVWRIFLRGRGVAWLRDVTPAHVSSYASWRRKLGEARRGKPCGPARCNRDLAHLKTLFGWLVLTERLKSNPAEGVKMAREDTGTREIVIVEPEPFEAMLAQLAPHWATACLALLSTGMRWSSLTRLKPEDLVESRRVVRLVKTKGKRANELQITSDRGWSALLEAARYPWARDVGGFDKALRFACEAAKVPRVTAHMLRHTFAVRALRAGANIRDVQRWLGHADLKTTERYLRFMKPTPPPEMV